MNRIFIGIFSILISVIATGLSAQTLEIATVEREPFSMVQDGEHVGFSIDLMRRVAESLGRDVTFETKVGFGEMLESVENGTVDAAIANISVTAERETRMDFSQPMFESGIQVLVPNQSNSSVSPFTGLFTWDILILILASLGLLFLGGMIMWFFERRAQPYFDRPMKEASFPAFWWALNLVVNGGFEERMPQSRFGRMFAVIMVVSSLFIVSIFVANITAAMTIKAITENVQDLNDLDGLKVATIEGSTSANFLRDRGIAHRTLANPQSLFASFEDGNLDAIVFDSPILAYYVAEKSNGSAMLLDRIYRPENYGIAFPTDSELREQVDRVLLSLREEGVFDELTIKWFGSAYAVN